MLRHVARRLEKRPQISPCVTSNILLLNNQFNHACRSYASATDEAAVQSNPTDYYTAPKSSRLTTLRNDRKAQQNATSIWPRNRRTQVGDHPSKSQKRLGKSLEHMAASQLLQKALGREDDTGYWRRRIAEFRSIRLPIVLLQEVIRKDESESKRNSGILMLLPTQKEMHTILSHPALAYHGREAFSHFIYVLRGCSDDERCRRFLEKPAPTPLFLFNFLIRSSSDIADTRNLLAMIEASQTYFSNPKQGKAEASRQSADDFHIGREISDKDSNNDQANFGLVMRLLVAQCLRLEPRFIVKLADTASRYIQHMTTLTTDPRRLFSMQCDMLNVCLQIFQPQKQLQAVQRPTPNAYFWEAQRILLTMSASLAKPLLISRNGFRAIRNVLSGQSKNYTEVHSSSRHAPGWPPYLQPGHGMDELSDPEDNWSRTVSAGMLMQEAGFSKTEVDDAVDILQGMSPDGAPTIQQRMVMSKDRPVGVWEASIRATRNAQEAWERFKSPAEPGRKPGLDQYAAMFEKLVLREVEPDSRLLPGDKALNFSTQHEANLAEFERARLRPPSVSELYHDMKVAGVAPDGACLHILVANADSLETAHRYLRDSSLKSRVIQNLLKDQPDSNLLKTVPLSLVAAYIQVCLRVGRRGGENQLMRVIRLAEMRLHNVKSRWAAFIWATILKDLSQHHRALRVSLAEQLRLITQVLQTIEASSSLQPSAFIQFSKSLRKIIRREVDKLLACDSGSELKFRQGFINALYGPKFPALQDTHVHSSHGSITSASDQPNVSRIVAPLREAGEQMKAMFWALAEREHDIQRHLGGYEVTPLERVNSRSDVVRSDQVHEYVLTLGFLGEFGEMARILSWLIQEWACHDVVSALSELEEPPPYADFFETFCVFRLVAEPMLENSIVESLLQKLSDSRLEWTWPDDEAVATYADLHVDGSVGTLGRVVKLELERQRNAAPQHLGD